MEKSYTKEGKYFLRKSISNWILCHIKTTFSPKNLATSGSICPTEGACSKSDIENPVINHTIFLSSSVFLDGLSKD